MTGAPRGHDRLRRGEDIAAALRGRRQRGGRFIALHVRDRGDDSPARVGVIASRRVGNAVHRNRAKRLAREALRAVELPVGIDVVVVTRPMCAEAGLAEVLAECRDLARGLGLVGATPEQVGP